MNDARFSLSLAGQDWTVFLARPTTPGPWPAVLVLHEIWGLNCDIEDIARQLARRGYLALAPDLIQGSLGCLWNAMRDLNRGQGPARDALVDAVRWLSDHDETLDGRVGVIGFCMGGGFAILLGVEPQVVVVAPNYGPAPRDPEHYAAMCPTVASYGGRDLPFLRDARALEQGLAKAGVEHDVVVYPGTGHSFLGRHPSAIVRVGMRALGMGPHPDNTPHAWARIHAFFHKHLTQESAP